MKAKLKEALELLASLEKQPSMWVQTQEALSMLIGHVFVLFDIERPWYRSSIIAFGEEQSVDIEELRLPVSQRWAAEKILEAKKYLVECGRLEQEPTPNGSFVVRIPIGLST
jgi:hypothetical protein